MSKYIQDKKTGRMLGAKPGPGRDQVPTPNVSPEPVEPTSNAAGNMVDSATRRYREHIKQLAVTTDTELAEQHHNLYRLERSVHTSVEALHYELNHHRRPRTRLRIGWQESTSETVREAEIAIQDADTPTYKRHRLEETLNTLRENQTQIEVLKERVHQLDTVYRQHRWNRAFLVPGGHVHSSMGCSTCNRNGSDTDFVWLPQYSGSDEAQIVDDAGERACTVCYPSAPVDILQRPTRIYSDDERQQLEAAEERRTQREQARAARAAKAPTASGEPLTVQVGTREWRGETHPALEEFKTERTALTYATDIIAAQQTGDRLHAPYNITESRYEEVKTIIINSVAEKRGVDPAEVLTEVIQKAEAKVRKFNREAERYRR